MLSTSAGNHLERLWVPSTRPNTVTNTMCGWMRINSTSGSTAWLAGLGINSANWIALKCAASGTNLTAQARINSSGTTYETASITVTQGVPFFYCVQRVGATLRLRINETVVEVATLPESTAFDTVNTYLSVGAVRTGGSFGNTLNCDHREFLYTESALTSGSLDTLYNAGVCSFRTFADFVDGRTDVFVYSDFSRDAFVHTGKQTHWAMTGSPTFTDDDGTEFPGNNRRSYVSRRVLSAISGLVGGWDFSAGTPDPEDVSPGLIGFDSAGTNYGDGTNLLECGTEADIATDSTTLPSGINLRDGGVFGGKAINMDQQAGYLRALRENCSAGLKAISNQVTLVMFARDCSTANFNTALFGMWHEGMNERQFALFAYLQSSNALIMHTSSDGGPTPPFDFNYDIAKSGQNITRTRLHTMAGSFVGASGSGTLRSYIDGVFEARVADGFPVTRGNPHTVAYDTLNNPSGTAPTDAWALWSSMTFGAVPTNLNSPTPPSGANLPTLENGPRNWMFYGAAVFDRVLTDAELAFIDAAVRSSQPAAVSSAQILPNGNLQVVWTAPVWASATPALGVSWPESGGSVFVSGAPTSGNGTTTHTYGLASAVPVGQGDVVLGLNNETPTLVGPTGDLASFSNFAVTNNAVAAASNTRTIHAGIRIGL